MPFSNSVMKTLFAFEFSNFTEFARRYRTVYGDAPDDKIAEYRDDILLALKENRIELADPRAHAFGLNFRAAGVIAPAAYAMRWSLLQRPGAFITSDRGLAMHDPTPPLPWTSHAWLSSPNVEVTIPLSSDICLRVDFPDRGTVVLEDVNEKDADTINLRTYGWAKDYIYGHSQDLLARVRRLSKQRPGDVVRPKPPQQTILLDRDIDDPSLAREHKRRGWPEYIPSGGILFDYVVIGPDSNPIEAAAFVDAKVKERVRRRLDLAGDESLPGHLSFEPGDID